MVDANLNFYDKNTFPFLSILEDNHKVIYEEYKSASRNAAVPCKDTHIHNNKWDVVPLKFQKKEFPDNIKLFPKLHHLYSNLPVEIETISFSIMAAQCEIYEHVNDDPLHMASNLLRGHLCLMTNSNAALVVNGETKKWKAGEAFVFDDKKPHSAYNRGQFPRINLLFDFYI